MKSKRSFDDRGLAAGFLSNALRFPERPAFVCEGRSYSYAQVDFSARKLATCLLEAIDGRPRRIGVLSGRNEVAYVGILAILLAGAAFVPLDPNETDEFLADRMRRAEIDAVIADDTAEYRIRGLLARLGAICALLPRSDYALDRSPNGSISFRPARISSAEPLRTPCRVAPTDVAYLMFTSGSTGVPKAVPISHGNVSAFIEYNHDRYAFTAEDRFSQNFRLTFDLSVFDIFMAWECGACFYSLDGITLPETMEFLNRNMISVWFSAPSVATRLRTMGELKSGSLPYLNWSLFCGEPLSAVNTIAWAAAANNSTIENLYGPTELTIACASYRWDRELSLECCLDGVVPIGSLYPTLDYLIVDPELMEVQGNAEGELCVAGPQTMAGYWGQPDFDTGAFIVRHAPDGVISRFYRTGDLVARHGDLLVFRGRNDRQVKVHGHRIELADVEARLRAEGWDEAVAFAWPDKRNAQAIIAAVCGEMGSGHPLDSLRDRLPASLRVAAVSLVSSMPLTANGKIDRQTLFSMLSGPQNGPDLPKHPLSPLRIAETSLEELRQLVANTLGIEATRVVDDLAFQSIAEWDSLRHVELLLSLEGFLGTRSADEPPLNPQSFSDIKALVLARGGVASEVIESASVEGPTLHRGLANVVMDESRITEVSATESTLRYRGYAVDELAKFCDFADLASLLIFGALPDREASAAFNVQVHESSVLPQAVVDLIDTLVHAHPIDVLLASVSLLAALNASANRDSQSKSETVRSAVTLFAQMPMVISTHHARRSGLAAQRHDITQRHASNFLTMLGANASPAAQRYLNQALIVLADHSSCASTLAARTAISSGASISAAIASAIAVFSGWRHGGATEQVLHLIDDIGIPGRAASHTAALIAAKRAVFGFGHRVYRAQDPRAHQLRSAAWTLAQHDALDTRHLEIADALVVAMSDRRRHGLVPNVDLYTGVGTRLLGLPDDLAVSVFVAGRVAGWLAHCIEQMDNNVLIRPLLRYSGPASRTLNVSPPPDVPGDPAHIWTTPPEE